MGTLRIVHYLNQFFAGIGGEEQSGVGPGGREGAVGPGVLLAHNLGPEAEVVATVWCGDDYFNEQPASATTELLALIAGYQPDLVIAGPAFNAGRYGIACGQVCTAVQERLGVPALMGLAPENPAVEMYRQQAIIVPTSESARGMATAIGKLAQLGLKLARGEKLGAPEVEGYLPHGLRFTEEVPVPAAVRAVDMLLQRLRGESFQTEWPLPARDAVPPPAPLTDLSRAKLALVTTSGLVPRGNPDRIESTYATKWGKYRIAGLDRMVAGEWETRHGGYDTTNANADPNRILPLDVLREFETTGVIGKLHDEYFVTVGSGASTTNAKRFAREILAELRAAGVDGVVFTVT
jgi:betaine reductase